MQMPQVPSLDQEAPLKKGMTTLSSILAWEISWTKEPGGGQSTGSQTVRHNVVIKQQLTTLLKADLSLLDDNRSHAGVELDAFIPRMPSRSLNLKVGIAPHCCS